MDATKDIQVNSCIMENEDPLTFKTESFTSSTPVIQEPVHVRQGSAAYWRDKYEQAMKAYPQNSERSMQKDEILGLPKISKVKPKSSKEKVRVIQLHR